MLARMNAFQASRDVVSLMYDTLGGSAVYSDKTPLDRHLRDVTTMCQHTMGQRKVREWVGQLLLTGKSDAPFL
jgi:alkylation response protein AidB-like acyl-CoA dehydrogenase